jgi:hypothetical protein
MKKLTLDLDKLAVESFAAMGEEGEGTVLGQEMATPGQSCLRTACCPETYTPGCTGTG